MTRSGPPSALSSHPVPESFVFTLRWNAGVNPAILPLCPACGHILSGSVRREEDGELFHARCGRAATGRREGEGR